MDQQIWTGRAFTLTVLVLVVLGTLIAYGGSVRVGFTFDDTYGISGNPSIRSLWNTPGFFSDPHTVWAEHSQVDLRPLVVTSFALNYALSGLNPWSYHAVNLLLHLVAVCLVFFVVRDFLWWPAESRGPAGGARLPAAAAALLFALAPLNSQPVIYLWARSALLCTVLYLAAFHSILGGRWRAAYLLHTLALLSKAIAVTLPATVLLYELLYRDREKYPSLVSRLRDAKTLARPVLVPALLDLVYVLYRQMILPPWTEEARRADWVTPGIWFMTQWTGLLHYVRLFLWPDRLSIDHDFAYNTSLADPRAWGSLLVLLVWAGLAWRYRDRFPQVAFGTFWFFLTLAPESSFLPLAEPVNEHRPYIASSLGLCFLLTWVLDRACFLLPPPRRTLGFAAATLLLAVAAVAVDRHRTWVWSDSLRLWEDTVRSSRNNSRAWMNAGLEYMSRGDFMSARRFFEKARALGPGYAYVYMNLSVLEAHEGNLEPALVAAREAVRLRPDLAQSHLYLGKALEKAGRRGEAMAAFQRGLELNPRDEELRREVERLARGSDPTSEEGLMGAGVYALGPGGDPEAAVAQFRRVLERNPQHYGAIYQLAAALDATGRLAEARPWWDKALALAEEYRDAGTAATARARLARSDEESDEAIMSLGLGALYKRSDPDTAAQHFRTVLARNPEHYGANFQLAMALDRLGRPAEARPSWEKVLRMAEGYRDVETSKTARTRLARRD